MLKAVYSFDFFRTSIHKFQPSIRVTLLPTRKSVAMPLPSVSQSCDCAATKRTITHLPWEIAVMRCEMSGRPQHNLYIRMMMSISSEVYLLPTKTTSCVLVIRYSLFVMQIRSRPFFDPKSPDMTSLKWKSLKNCSTDFVEIVCACAKLMM